MSLLVGELWCQLLPNTLEHLGRLCNRVKHVVQIFSQAQA